MAQLPLISDPDMMQQRWKSLLDPILAGSARQLEIGPIVKVAGSTGSTTYVTTNNALTLDFTAASDATYRIDATVFLDSSSTGQVTFCRIQPLLGNPNVSFSQEAACFGNGGSVAPYLLAQLKEGTRYTFALQLKVSGGTGGLRNDIPSNGQALVAQEL